MARQESVLTAGAARPDPARILLQELRGQGLLAQGSSPRWLAPYLAELGRENDAELFYQGLLNVAGRLRAESQDLPAQLILSRLSQDDVPAGLRQKAIRELSAYGGGAFGLRSEFLLSRFCANATDWRVVAPMLGASLVGRVAGSLTLGRLVGTARGAWFSAGFGARFAAGTAGYLAEVPTFAALSRATSPHTNDPFSADLARSALTLGALKVFGGLGHSGARWLTSAGASPGFSANAVAQLSALAGLIGAHRLEAAFGLRPHLDGGALLLDSLATLLAMHIGSRLGAEVLGPGYSRLQRDLEIRSRLLAAPVLGRGPLAPEARAPFAVAQVGSGRFHEGNEAAWSRPGLMMSNSNEGDGKKGDSLAPLEVPSLVGNSVRKPGAPPRANPAAEEPAKEPGLALRRRHFVLGDPKHQAFADEPTFPAPEVLPGEAPSVIIDPSLHGPADPYIGRLIDSRFKIEEKLGEGGMGKVFLATHQVLGKKVAIKVLRDGLASDKEVVSRFLTEARAASRIGNPHIVDVSDFGRLPDGTVYFVMEYLKGIPVSKLLENGQGMPLPRLIHIARQVAEGMGAAHREKIVHRDLKPDNILLVQQGSMTDFVKIFDFGIAKILNSKARLTAEGSTFGSVHYMSPEQAMGIELDGRSDIYSFGVMLYEMATGKLPFDHPDRMQILHAHLRKPVPNLNETAPWLPKELVAIINRSLEKKPDKRYWTMEEVDVALARVQATVSPVSPVKVETSMLPVLAAPPSPPSENKAQPAPRPPPAETEFMSWPAAPRRRWPFYLGIGGGSAAMAVALAAALMRTNRSTRASQDAGAPPDSLNLPPPDAALVEPRVEPILPPAPRQVTLTLSPVDAHVFRDGKDLGAESVSLSVEEGTVVELEVRRRGYKTQNVVLDGSQEKISVRLERKKPIQKPKPPQDNPPKIDPPKNAPPEEIFIPWGGK